MKDQDNALEPKKVRKCIFKTRCGDFLFLSDAYCIISSLHSDVGYAIGIADAGTKCVYGRLFRITTHRDNHQHAIHNAAGIVSCTAPSCIQYVLPMHSIVVFRNKLSQPPPPRGSILSPYA
jgi:hypothetical protein